MSGKGTPATKAADKAKISYKLHEYVHDPAVDSYGLEAAEALQTDPRRVHKTLVASVERQGRNELCVAIVPVDTSLDLKALASAVDGKRAEMADVSLVEKTTGYVRGGISPLGQRKVLRTVLDSDALGYETIFVSAGRRGLDIELSPHDLVKAIPATTAPIAKPR